MLLKGDRLEVAMTVALGGKADIGHSTQNDAFDPKRTLLSGWQMVIRASKKQWSLQVVF